MLRKRFVVSILGSNCYKRIGSMGSIALHDSASPALPLDGRVDRQAEAVDPVHSVSGPYEGQV